MPALDPVRLYLQDFNNGTGRITVACYGEAWETFFNAIGPHTLVEFLKIADADYLTGKLFSGAMRKSKLAYLRRIVAAVKTALETLPQEPTQTP